MYEQFLFINVSSCIILITDFIWECFNLSQVCGGIHFSKLMRQSTAPFICFILLLLLSLILWWLGSLLVLSNNYLYGSSHPRSPGPWNCHWEEMCVCVCLQERPRTLRMPLRWAMWNCLVCHWPSTLGCMHMLDGRYGPHTHTHTHIVFSFHYLSLEVIWYLFLFAGSIWTLWRRRWITLNGKFIPQLECLVE